MAKRASQKGHDAMVQAVVNYLVDEDAENICADLPGHDRPRKISWRKTKSGHIPDATADGFLFEVETDDSIDDGHTEDQWTLFAAYAEQNNERFVVVVPDGSDNDAHARLAELGITAEVWTA